MLRVIGTIIIGFVAGVIAKLVTPGDNELQGFMLTTVLGIVGAFVATYLGQAVGWYGPDHNADFIGAIVTRAGKRAPSIEKLETINQIGRAC